MKTSINKKINKDGLKRKLIINNKHNLFSLSDQDLVEVLLDSVGGPLVDAESLDVIARFVEKH